MARVIGAEEITWLKAKGIGQIVVIVDADGVMSGIFFVVDEVAFPVFCIDWDDLVIGIEDRGEGVGGIGTIAHLGADLVIDVLILVVVGLHLVEDVDDGVLILAVAFHDGAVFLEIRGDVDHRFDDGLVVLIRGEFLLIVLDEFGIFILREGDGEVTDRIGVDADIVLLGDLRADFGFGDMV